MENMELPEQLGHPALLVQRWVSWARLESLVLLEQMVGLVFLELQEELVLLERME
jgi:hypothetical protein